RTIPARGPASVLWVGDVTTSQCSTGLGWSPAATSPAECAKAPPSRAAPGGGEPGEVPHVAPEQPAALVGDPAEPRGVDRARIRRAAADHDLRPVFARQRAHLVLGDDDRLARHRIRGAR